MRGFILDLLQLNIRRVPKQVPVTVLLKNTISALAAYRVSYASLQSRHCDASVGFICQFPLRVVFDEMTNELYDTSVTRIKKSAWEVGIVREVFPSVRATEGIQSGPYQLKDRKIITFLGW
jgi:hypothetical protein